MTIIRKKIVFLFLAILFIISINNVVGAKYIMDSQAIIAELDIDRTKPKIELMQIKNTNERYEKYANKTHKITLKIKVTDKNLKEVILNNETIDVKIGNISSQSKNITIKEISKDSQTAIYEIELDKITQDGNLNVILKEGVAVDKGDLKSDEFLINTGICIDNVAPIGKFLENKIADGKVNGIVTLNEGIRSVDGWNFSDNGLKISKEFTNNISYELPIIDYAGNSSIVQVNITQATFIKLTYASHNSEVGWTFGYGNYDIAGKNAIQKNPILKTEAIAFNVGGNVAKDFVQANAYVYTNWGPNSTGRCAENKILYYYGYNPSKTTFKSMLSSDLVNINGKSSFQFGGSGINQFLNTDVNGNNPISYSDASQYKYGISSITLKLKDYSQFSIVYQILVNKYGWTLSKSNGEECVYNHTLPMSAFRIALVPKSEKQHVIDTWNKDVGTNNLK